MTTEYSSIKTAKDDPCFQKTLPGDSNTSTQINMSDSTLPTANKPLLDATAPSGCGGGVNDMEPLMPGSCDMLPMANESLLDHAVPSCNGRDNDMVVTLGSCDSCENVAINGQPDKPTDGDVIRSVPNLTSTCTMAP